MNDKFPKYLVKSVITDQKQFVDIYTAANRQGSWFSPWDVLDDVLEEDGIVRAITKDEVNSINDICDEIDANK